MEYNPTGICGYGFGLLELYDATEDEKYLAQFKKIADWLISNQVSINISNLECGLWYYYDTNPPWISAMAQGQGISILTRAYKLFKDKEYIEACTIAMNSFYIAEEEGGTYSINEGDVFLEEYPNKETKHVLNGFIYAMLGVWDYYKITNDLSAQSLFEKCVLTLERNLEKYDLGYWTLYNLPKRTKYISSRWYNQIHINMMEIMYNITNKEVFMYYNRMWNKYDKSLVCRIRALLTKIIGKF